MSLVPRLIETMLRDPFDDYYPVVAVDYPTRRSWNQMNNALRQLDRMSSQMKNELGAVKDSKHGFEVAVDCGHFKPEEINVKLVDGNNLVIEANHEERSDAHGYISRQFKRRYVLPDNVELEKMESNLSVDGVLSIKAPKKVVDAVTGERSIPISLTNKVHSAVEGGDRKKQEAEKMETK